MLYKAPVLFVSLLGFVFAFAASAPVPSRSLRDAAQHSGILIGAAARPAHLSESAYAATLAREFNLLEPEDALKWEAVRPDAQSFDFHQADQLVNFALRHNMKIRGHTLVWHQQNPRWLLEGKFTPDQLSKLLETHIKTVIEHYRGKIFAWDVVNEAFDEGAHTGQLRSTIWYDQPGIGYAGQGTKYLAQCFRWAHEADPEALLFYNEAEADEIGPKSDAVYAMVREFKLQGVPIDGVGLQCTSEARFPTLHQSPPISRASQPSAFRFTSPKWTSHCQSMRTAMPAPATCKNKRTSIARLQEPVSRIPAARQFKPGGSRIDTHGSGRTPKKPEARRCCSIGTISRSLPTTLYGMPSPEIAPNLDRQLAGSKMK